MQKNILVMSFVFLLVLFSFAALSIENNVSQNISDISDVILEDEDQSVSADPVDLADTTQNLELNITNSSENGYSIPAADVEQPPLPDVADELQSQEVQNSIESQSLVSEQTEQVSNGEKRRYIIQLKNSERAKSGFSTQSLATLESTVRSLASDYSNLKVRHVLKYSDSISMDLTQSEYEQLMQDTRVQTIYPSQTVYAMLQDSVPQIGAANISQRLFGDVNLSASNQTICILDTGINFTHPDLGGCFGAGCKVVGGWDYVNDVAVPVDDGTSNHGTHVAGIVAANGSIVGVAPGARLYSMKVLDASGQGAVDDLAAAIEACVGNSSVYNISVISMSLGSAELYTTACDSAYTTWTAGTYAAYLANISVVAASGNNGSNTGISAPACISNVTAVASAVVADNAIAGHANTNALVSLLAPGVDVNSTNSDDSYVEYDGTSMATPHVAGALAVLHEVMARKGLEANVTELFLALNSTGKIISYGGQNFVRINLTAAVNFLADVNIPNIKNLTISNQTIGRYQNFSVWLNATDNIVGNSSNITRATLTINSTTINLTNVTPTNFTAINISPSANFSITDSGSYQAMISVYDYYNNLNTSNFTLTVDAVAAPMSVILNVSYTNISTATVNITINSTEYIRSASFAGHSLDWDADFSRFNISNYTVAHLGCVNETACAVVVDYTDDYYNPGSATGYLYFDTLAPRFLTNATTDSGNAQSINSTTNTTFRIVMNETNLSTVFVNETTVMFFTSNGTHYLLNASATDVGCSPNTVCTVNVYANDTFNATNSTTIQLIVDDVAPNIIDQTARNNTWTRSVTPNFKWNVTDAMDAALTCNFTLNGNQTAGLSMTNNSLTQILTNSSYGLSTGQSYNYFLNCTDDAGNVNQTAILSFGVDTVKPNSSALINLTTATYYNASVMVNFSVTDLDSGAYTQYRNYTNQSWVNATQVNITSALPNNLLYYRAVDNAGNAQVSQSLALFVDVTAPTISEVLASSNVLVNSTNFTVQIAASDAGSGLATTASIVFNGTTYTATKGAYYYTATLVAPSQDGWNLINATVTDLAGNSVYHDSMNITVDSTIPSVVASAVNGSIIANTTVLYFNFSQFENASINYTCGYGIANTTGGQAELGSQLSIGACGLNGTMTLNITLNGSSADVVYNYTYVIDAVVPFVNLTNLSSASVLRGLVDVGVTASDQSGILNITFSVNDTQIASDSVAPYNFTLSTAQYPHGTYNVTVVATDYAGLTNSSTTAILFNNSVADVIQVSDDYNSSAGAIYYDDFANTAVGNLLYSIEGLSSSNITVQRITNLTNTTVGSENITIVVGIINITADTNTTATQTIMIESSRLAQFGFVAPYTNLTFYVDHNTGIWQKINRSYLGEFNTSGVSYRLFQFNTTEYSLFMWGANSTTVAASGDDDDDDDSSGSSGSSSSSSIPDSTYTGPSFTVNVTQQKTESTVYRGKTYAFTNGANKFTVLIENISMSANKVTLYVTETRKQYVLSSSSDLLLTYPDGATLRVSLSEVLNEVAAKLYSVTTPAPIKQTVAEDTPIANISTIEITPENTNEGIDAQTVQDSAIDVVDDGVQPANQTLWMVIAGIVVIVIVVVAISMARSKN